MKVPDWRQVDLCAGILCEGMLDNQGIALWLPAKSDDDLHHWERIGSVPGTEVAAGDGLCVSAATSLQARQQVRGLFGKLFGRGRTPVEEQTWVLPTGAAAQQQGERRTDLLLVWAEDDRRPLDEARVRTRWPQGQGYRRLGPNLFVVSGVTGPGAAGGLAPLAGCPREQAERLLAAARQAGDRRREVLALTDVGAVGTDEGQAVSAVSLLEEALALATDLDDPALETDVLGHLGVALVRAGQPGRALEPLERARAWAAAAGDRYGEKAALERLGHAWSSLRDTDRATAAFGQALILARALGDGRHEAELLWQLAIQHAESGQREQSLAAGQAAVNLWTQRGHPHASAFADQLQKYRTAPPEGTWTPVAPPTAAGEWLVGFTEPSAAPADADAGPGLLRMALSAAKSLAQAVGSGLKTVPAATHRKRLQTCMACEHHTGVRCQLCGCFTKVKAWLPHETCPLNRWPG